jgi:hypothetical protein
LLNWSVLVSAKVDNKLTESQMPANVYTSIFRDVQLVIIYIEMEICITFFSWG